MVALLRGLLSRRIGPRVYPLRHSKSYGTALYRAARDHPLGHYFDALYLTGFYYRFIGVSQLTTALLLLIPRTALLGALLYLPIIFNICVLAYATRFEGTRITTLMVLANLYLLCWDYARLKYVLPFRSSSGSSSDGGTTPNQKMSRKFPWVFFGGVVAIVAAVITINALMYDIRPGNSELECTNGCRNNTRPEDCLRFCKCIYDEGNPLDKCLNEYRNRKE